MKWSIVPAQALVDVGAVAGLVQNLDGPDFDRALLEALGLQRQIVLEACGISCSASRQVQAVRWFGRRADAAQRSLRLAATHFTHDPMLGALPANARDGDSYVSTVRSSAIEDDAHRWDCFDDPGFAQRVSIARAADGGWAVLCLYLGHALSNDADVMRMAGMATLAFPFVARHNGWQEGVLDAPLPQDPAQRLAEQMGKRFPTLTLRERLVCAMTVLGKDSNRIARDLAITRSTVLTYRRRAYLRLGVSSASALMAELV